MASIEPASGPITGETTVTIKGSGFTKKATVQIGSPATSVDVHSSTEITATTAATSAGSDEVVVSDLLGKSAHGPSFTYVGPPAKTNFLYFDEGSDDIGRAGLEASGLISSFLTVARSPCGEAVDEGHVYWANSADNTIGRANLDGTEANPKFIRGAASPCGVAVDAGYVYWANTEGGTIGRAGIGGGEVNERFVTGIGGRHGGALGVAVDAGHVYWGDGGADVGRAAIGGGEVQRKFISAAHDSSGVAVSGEYLYWTNAANGTIGRAKVDGSAVQPSFIRGAGAQPCAGSLSTKRTSTGASEKPAGWHAQTSKEAKCNDAPERRARHLRRGRRTRRPAARSATTERHAPEPEPGQSLRRNARAHHRRQPDRRQRGALRRTRSARIHRHAQRLDHRAVAARQRHGRRDRADDRRHERNDRRGRVHVRARTPARVNGGGRIDSAASANECGGS